MGLPNRGGALLCDATVVDGEIVGARGRKTSRKPNRYCVGARAGASMWIDSAAQRVPIDSIAAVDAACDLAFDLSAISKSLSGMAGGDAVRHFESRGEC